MNEERGRNAIQSTMAMVSTMQYEGDDGKRTANAYRRTGELWHTLEPSEQASVAIGLTAIVCDLLASRAREAGVTVEEALGVYGAAAAAVEFKEPDDESG